MTVALSDTQLLTDMLRPLHSFKNPVTTASTTSEFYTLRKPVSATINTLANALYQVISYSLEVTITCKEQALVYQELCQLKCLEFSMLTLACCQVPSVLPTCWIAK